MLGVAGTEYNFLYAKEIEQRPFTEVHKKNKVKASIEFQVSSDLRVQAEEVTNTIAVMFGIIGGQIIFCVLICSLFFSRFVPWLMYVEIIRELFKVDPSKAKKPKAVRKFEKKSSGDILA